VAQTDYVLKVLGREHLSSGVARINNDESPGDDALAIRLLDLHFNVVNIEGPPILLV